MGGSDQTLKDNVTDVDPGEVLRRLAALPISTWNYKWDAPTVRHLGPGSEDFRAAFGVGDDDRSIFLLDGIGVALAAIQALSTALEEQRAEIERLRAAVASNRPRGAF